MQNSFKARACACGRGNVRGGASFGSVSGPAMTCAGVGGCARPRHTRRAPVTGRGARARAGWKGGVGAASGGRGQRLLSGRGNATRARRRPARAAFRQRASARGLRSATFKARQAPSSSMDCRLWPRPLRRPCARNCGQASGTCAGACVCVLAVHALAGALPRKKREKRAQARHAKHTRLWAPAHLW